MLPVGQAGGCDGDHCNTDSFSCLIEATHALLFARVVPLATY
jgi:hypothetical protein